MEGDCNVYAHSSLWMRPTGEWSINVKMVYTSDGRSICLVNIKKIKKCVEILIDLDFETIWQLCPNLKQFDNYSLKQCWSKPSLRLYRRRCYFCTIFYFMKIPIATAPLASQDIVKKKKKIQFEHKCEWQKYVSEWRSNLICTIDRCFSWQFPKAISV